MSQKNTKLDPYNRGGMWAFLFSMAFSIIFFIYIAFFQGGVKLGEIPDEVKVAMAQEAEAADSAKPWEASEAMIQKGQKAFVANCASCHEASGKADGPTGKAVGARNLVEGQWKKGGDSISLFNTVTNGLEGTSMVAFGSIPLADRWAIVQFIRSITNNKGEDDPKALEEFASSAK